MELTGARHGALASHMCLQRAPAAHPWSLAVRETSMNTRGEVLVAIMNNQRDLAAAREEHWYRIPVSSAKKWLSECWPPEWLALYQTKVFQNEAHAVTYYARVRTIRQVARWQLFPDQTRDAKSMQRYYQLLLDPLQRLPAPIYSRRLRRIVFIPTTWQKFTSAVEINDLFHGSPLEDRLWAVFKQLRILAERQEFLVIESRYYALDFAIYCAKGKIDVETDGDTWHANPEKAAIDNRRDNALKMLGWFVLRFTTRQVMEELMDYCLPTVITTINTLKGVDEGGVLPRKIDLQGGVIQRGLFDDL